MDCGYRASSKGISIVGLTVLSMARSSIETSIAGVACYSVIQGGCVEQNLVGLVLGSPYHPQSLAQRGGFVRESMFRSLHVE